MSLTKLGLYSIGIGLISTGFLMTLAGFLNGPNAVHSCPAGGCPLYMEYIMFPIPYGLYYSGFAVI